MTEKELVCRHYDGFTRHDYNTPTALPCKQSKQRRDRGWSQITAYNRHIITRVSYALHLLVKKEKGVVEL